MGSRLTPEREALIRERAADPGDELIAELDATRADLAAAIARAETAERQAAQQAGNVIVAHNQIEQQRARADEAEADRQYFSKVIAAMHEQRAVAESERDEAIVRAEKAEAALPAATYAERKRIAEADAGTFAAIRARGRVLLDALRRGESKEVVAAAAWGPEGLDRAHFYSDCERTAQDYEATVRAQGRDAAIEEFDAEMNAAIDAGLGLREGPLTGGDGVWQGRLMMRIAEIREDERKAERARCVTLITERAAARRAMAAQQQNGADAVEMQEQAAGMEEAADALAIDARRR
jgi:hypothetical protein